MENDFVRWLRTQLPTAARLMVGAGDDAAVLRVEPPAEVVVTTDMLMEGVDFELAHCSPERVGRKSLAVNLSDLAAMAATPIAAFVSLALPREGGERLARELYAGILPLAEEFGAVVAGGDTNSWDGPLVVSVTALGEVQPGQAWLRSGARAGDVAIVTGSFGGSILGKHFDFTPRVREALLLAERYQVHAAMDVSDGLSLDLSRLVAESHCGVALDLHNVPLSAAAEQMAREHGSLRSALDHALSDGEDFELILAVPPAEAERMLAEQPLAVPLTAIGQFIAQPGLWARSVDGKLEPLPPRGYQHRLEP
jgi:thiamine-monophosphate kinase